MYLRTLGTATFKGLGVLGEPIYSWAYGVSGNGSTVVGNSYNVSYEEEAFRWTPAGGMKGLGDLDGGNFLSLARDASFYGSVVVGFSHSGSGYQAFRWTGGVMTGLGDLEQGAFDSRAYRVSDDGLVVVGEGQSALGMEAFRWTVTTGIVGLGYLPGGDVSSVALAVSADGSVVVGQANAFSLEAEAFIWDQTDGLRSLSSLLASKYGLNLTGWSLTSVEDISANGLVIVGYGTNPLGQTEAWRVTLPNPVPIPGAALLGAIGLSFAGWRLRRKAA